MVLENICYSIKYEDRNSTVFSEISYNREMLLKCRESHDSYRLLFEKTLSVGFLLNIKDLI